MKLLELESPNIIVFKADAMSVVIEGFMKYPSGPTGIIAAGITGAVCQGNYSSMGFFTPFIALLIRYFRYINQWLYAFLLLIYYKYKSSHLPWSCDLARVYRMLTGWLILASVMLHIIAVINL